MITEDDLLFTPIREGTPQWNVSYQGKVLFRVTQRIMASPPYSLVRIENDKDTGEVFCEDRDQIVENILHVLNGD